MAYTREIKAIKKNKNIEERFTIHWWEKKKLLKDFVFREEVWHFLYTDYYYVIKSKEQLEEVHKKYKRFAKKFTEKAWDTPGTIKQIENIISNFEDYKEVQIMMMEWESGLE
jgi:hypothetical protein